MSYREFSLREIKHTFQLQIVEDPDLFASAAEVSPSPFLQSLLQVYTLLALAINTE